jgi:outer membrane protein assembly factor BamB
MGDGTTTETIAKPWDSAGPKQVWTASATSGFSSIAVGDGIAATLMTREIEGNQTETAVAWDAKSGKELWAAPLKLAKYDGGGDSGSKDNRGGDGPRSTPSIANGRVFVLGSNLDLHCFDAKSGKKVWDTDLVKDHGGGNIRWQSAASPLLEGDLCIVAGGGKSSSLLAFDQRSGQVKWKGEDEVITHATPVAATIHNVRQIIFFMKSGLVSVDPKDGSVLWKQNYQYNTSTAASPIVWQDIVYCSAGYGVGGGAFRIKKSGTTFSSEEIWRTQGKNSNHWSTPVVKDGYLYGMFQFKEYGTGPVACVDIRTGEEKWRQPGFGPGNVIMAGQKLVALSDKGELVLIDPKPDGYAELARADVLEGKCWSTPTLANGMIYARSTTQAACFDTTK